MIKIVYCIFLIKIPILQELLYRGDLATDPLNSTQSIIY